MAIIKPFKGIRPTNDKVHLVASRPLDNYKTQELNAKLAENPYTFLQIIKPEFGQSIKTKPGSTENLKKIKTKFEDFCKEDILYADQEETFYIYQQINGNESSTGIIGCASIDDYFNNIIKKHEQTLTHKEEILKNYLEVCEFNAEPVSLIFPSTDKIDDFLQSIAKEKPEYDFTTTDKLRHKLWIVNTAKEIELITSQFKKISSIYIADGHHRTASSALLGKQKRERQVEYTGDEPFNYLMAIFFPENQLKIYDYNRIIKDLNGLSVKEFIAEVSKKFEVNKIDSEVYKPNQNHNFSMYVDGIWYSLNAKVGTYNPTDPIDSLDAAILSNNILEPILGIKDLKTDKRVGFINGIKGMKELKHQVDTLKADVAFGLYPVTMEQLKLISETNNIMPPKSTWVEPKLRSGLTIFSLK